MTKQFTRRELLASAVVASTVGVSGCQTRSRSDQKDGGTDTATSISTTTDTATSTKQEQSTDGAIQAPTRSIVGDPLHVQLTGYKPNTPVSLKASATDTMGDEYTKTWSLRTDDNGMAAISPSEPLPGRSVSTWVGTNDGFRTANPAAFNMLLHTLRPATDSPVSKPFTIANATEVTFKAHIGATQRPKATQTTTRVYTDWESATQQLIDSEGLVGRLYLPSSAGPHPAIITLHGSKASLPNRLSLMLATQGYATFALQYFGAKELPDSLSRIPLEYFQRAIRWLTARDEVRDDGIGFVGISRGVEPALLAAADYDGPARVVGYSGSGVIAPAVSPDKGSNVAWLRNGDPIAPPDAVKKVFHLLWRISQEDHDITSVPERVRESLSATTLNRTLIPVEEIDGSVLLFAGGDDQLWPAPLLSVLAINRLKRRGHPYPYGVSVYSGAGHVFMWPYTSYNGRLTSETYGGTPEANARAAAAAWPLLLKCLKQVSQSETSQSQ